ncbi:hypothetical protein [Flavobacterium sp. HNIBRBA15423]|uniref:hypothetical protein n=1 Tax=Flavobacterium sp. HNIBRBA15423 TaxID=3458683 RepID=UPI004044CABE
MILIICDLTYTYVFYKCIPRNKLQYVLKSNNNEYDNMFIGSSRVANHIDVKYLDSLSEQKNLNLGVEGANYADNLLMLKLFIKNNNKVNKIFLQLDHFYEYNEMSAIANSDALPFIRNEVVNAHFKKYDKRYCFYYYFPFYRYQSADFKIGFREFSMSLINKKPKVDFNYGYIPKFDKGDITTFEKFPKKIVDNNIFVDEIINLCNENNIKIVLFCAPFCSFTKDLSYIDNLKMRYPDLNNYSKAMNDVFFSNCSHLNDKGAREFTHIIFDNHMKNE